MMRWLHLGRILLGVSLLLPFVLSAGLGFVWLYEKGWLLWFAGGSVALAAVARLGLWLVTRRALAAPQTGLTHPAPDAGWTPVESASFARAQAEIARRIATPVDWNTLPTEALSIVEFVAVDLSQGQRTALDFTLPEALLLVERVGRRYRRFLLATVPFADTLSVRTLHWAWRRQDDALAAWETGFLAWRGVRMLTNPAAALMREAERAMARGLQGHLTEGLRRDAQIILLEEAAQAAIDLYSGRLKASDDELRALAAAQDSGDAAALAPLRVLVLGQQGAGTSSVMAGLVADPQTAGLQPLVEPKIDCLFHAQPLTLIERKLSADPAKDAQAIAGADMVVWVHKAARPGRAPDQRLLTHPGLSQPGLLPPVLHVIAGADQVTGGNGGGMDAQIARSVAEALTLPPPLCVELGTPARNLPALHKAVRDQLTQARRVQRARLSAAAAQGAGASGNMRRLGNAGRALWQRLARRD